MRNWKRFGVLAVGAALAGLVGPQTRAELPPHGQTGKGGTGPAAPGKAAPKGKKLEIAFAGGAVAINGKKITLPADEKDLVAALGRPDRASDPAANKILTWDELGVFAYIKPGTTTCHAFAVTLRREAADFWPKKPFPGVLTVDGAELRNDSKIEDVNREKTGKPFEPNEVLTDVWSIEYGKATLYLRRSPNPKNGFIKLELGIPSS